MRWYTPSFGERMLRMPLHEELLQSFQVRWRVFCLFHQSNQLFVHTNLDTDIGEISDPCVGCHHELTDCMCCISLGYTQLVLDALVHPVKCRLLPRLVLFGTSQLLGHSERSN